MPDVITCTRRGNDPGQAVSRIRAVAAAAARRAISPGAWDGTGSK